jgi:hypothetical protein
MENAFAASVAVGEDGVSDDAGDLSEVGGINAEVAGGGRRGSLVGG